MPNIRVDLSSAPINGQTLTFKSPTDCSQVEGLKVYYPEGNTTTSKVFEFADAHGNNVGSIDLFAADVLVKVILDTELERAYVQNADTNAYLENRFSALGITATDDGTGVVTLALGGEGSPSGGGKDGKDGITPHIGDNGNWWLGEVDTGISAHGYTPVKGVDYWTEADKQEIVADVIVDVGVDDSKVGNKPWSSKNTVDKLAIRSEASGDAISVSDASNLPLQGLTLYGKTTQDGTPTPDAPVALESVGDGGSVGVKVLGKNLLPFKYKNKSTTINGVTATVNDDGSITWSGTATGYLGFPLCSNAPISDFPTVFTVLALGTYKNVTIQVAILDDGMYLYNADMQSKSQTINLADYPTAKTINIAVKRKNDGLETSGTIYPMVVAGAVTSAEYEPYKEPQTLTASTPNGLHGIPAASGGNYTDESGQQWICDEMDFEPGVYIQNVDEFILKGTESWALNSSAKNPYFYIRFTPENPIKSGKRGLCSHFPYESSPNMQPAGSIVFGWNSTYTNLLFASGHSSVDEWKAYLAEQYATGTPVTIRYCLATPIEKAMSVEEIEAFKALHSNKLNTTVLNDSNIGMKLEYIADTKAYIDNKFTELQNAILATGANV